MDPDRKRLAVITGGHGDLARETARSLADRGWEVLTPGRHQLDVADPAQVERWFASLQRIDLLVNAAGVRRDRRFGAIEEADWDSVSRVCLRGAFLCSRAAAQRMAGAGGGTIVNIGSHSSRGAAGQAAYAAAKAALEGLTRALATEWGPANIRVNCVLPGWLETRFTADVPPAVAASALRRHVLGRFARVRQAAAFIAHLADMPDVSGQVMAIDSRILA